MKRRIYGFMVLLLAALPIAAFAQEVNRDMEPDSNSNESRLSYDDEDASLMNTLVVQSEGEIPRDLVKERYLRAFNINRVSQQSDVDFEKVVSELKSKGMLIDKGSVLSSGHSGWNPNR
jgi:hypothetical protein